jgi:hypothetical protein
MVCNVQNVIEATLVGKVSQSAINALVHAKLVKEILKNASPASQDITLIVPHVFNAIRDVNHAQVLHFALLVTLIV